MFRWRTITLLILVLMAGCGFKLRGSFDLPPWFNHISLTNLSADKDLVRIVKKQLQGAGVHIVPGDARTAVQLVIIKDNLQQQITGISSSTTPRQYRLIYSAYFSMLKNNKMLIPSTKVVVTRQLTINNDRILGSNFEESTLYHEMRQDAAAQIINRLSRALSHAD